MNARSIITLLAIATIGCGQDIELPAGEPLDGPSHGSVDEQALVTYLVDSKPVTAYDEVRDYYRARFSAAGLELPGNASVVHLSQKKFVEAYRALASHAAPEGLRGFTVREGHSAKIVMPAGMSLAEHRATFAHEVGHAYAAGAGGNRGELPAELVSVGVALAELSAYPRLALGGEQFLFRAPAATASECSEYHLAVLASLGLLIEERMDLGRALQRALASEAELLDEARQDAAAHADGPLGLFRERVAELTRSDVLASALSERVGADRTGAMLDYLELGAETEALQARIVARSQGPEQGRLEAMRDLGVASVEKNRGYPSDDFPQVRRAHVYSFYAATWAETSLLDDGAALALAEEFIETFGERFGQGGYLDRIAPEMLYLAAYAAAGLGQRCEASQYLDRMVTQYPHTQDADELAAAAGRMADSCE